MKAVEGMRLSYFVVEDAVEEEDEEALQRVEDCEDVREHHLPRAAAHPDEPHAPRQTQQHDEHHRALDPRPARGSSTNDT